MQILEWQTLDPQQRRAALSRPTVRLQAQNLAQAQAVIDRVRAEGDAALAERLGTVDYGDVLAAEGVVTVALDDEGRLVRHGPDGTTTFLD